VTTYSPPLSIFLHISTIGIYFLRDKLNHLRKILKIGKMDEKEEIWTTLEDLDKVETKNRDLRDNTD
jgi:septal ring factor EnvC (AmiA/AmiB activator)